MKIGLTRHAYAGGPKPPTASASANLDLTRERKTHWSYVAPPKKPKARALVSERMRQLMEL